jgi:soluble lytic murein transglycosylase-like protein
MLFLLFLFYIYTETNLMFLPSRGTAAKVVEQWSPLAAGVAAEYGVPVKLILSFVCVESAGNPYAKSLANAYGLMQVKQPALADVNERFGKSWKFEDLADPQIGLAAGAAYFAIQLDRQKGNVQKAIQAYYAGSAAVDKNPNEAVWYFQRVSSYLNLIEVMT